MIHQYPHLLGDVDGDGRDDLIFLFRQDGQFKVRVKLANAGGFGVSTETAHPDGGQIPHYRPILAKVNSDSCSDIIFPHRASDGIYRLRTFFASCDGSQILNGRE